VFDGSQSEGLISEWLWDFGDDETGTGPKVNHAYDPEFLLEKPEITVIVRLTVRGPYGSDSAATVVRVFDPGDLLALVRVSTHAMLSFGLR
jgi:PKD repeat protein